uniref:Uncharacterized protein n=1 Tax=Vespula pensylvanica TaxID=30213 RepID=A0A834UFL6_VESPE|nr:hypothetical protein H0235_004099 [Vespula pensylvanica]
MNLPSGFILRAIQKRYMSTLSRRSLNDSTREPIGPKFRAHGSHYSTKNPSGSTPTSLQQPQQQQQQEQRVDTDYYRLTI